MTLAVTLAATPGPGTALGNVPLHAVVQSVMFDPGLSTHQRITAILVAVFMLGVVLELVRRRKLREEYSLLWIGTALILMAGAIEPRLLSLVATAIGAKLPSSALFFGALAFLMAVSMLISIRLSRQAIRSKALARQTALVEEELEQQRGEIAQLKRDLGDLRGDKLGSGLSRQGNKDRRKDGAA